MSDYKILSQTHRKIEKDTEKGLKDQEVWEIVLEPLSHMESPADIVILRRYDAPFGFDKHKVVRIGINEGSP